MHGLMRYDLLNEPLTEEDTAWYPSAVNCHTPDSYGRTKTNDNGNGATLGFEAKLWLAI